MKTPDSVYEAEQDSRLLLKSVRDRLPIKKGLKICEVGIGSGFILVELEKEFPRNKYFASDINQASVDFCKAMELNVSCGNLLEPFNDKFDLIYFNTPYLPTEDGEKFEELSMTDKAIYGGKNGYEVIEEFILQVNDKLRDTGEVFILFSSLSKPGYIKEVLEKNLFEFEEVGRENAGMMEELIVWRFWKSDILKRISKHVSNVRYLASGKHSVVLDGESEMGQEIVKVGLPKDIEVEVKFTKKFEKEGFAPKFFYAEDDFIIREKLEGELIEDFFERASKLELEKVLNEILRICQRMDEMGINKLEMTHPYKHIYVFEDLSVKMIDFERSIFTEKPKNTTQVLQYFRRFINKFKEKGLELSEDKMFEISKKYKKKSFKFELSEIIL